MTPQTSTLKRRDEKEKTHASLEDRQTSKALLLFFYDPKLARQADLYRMKEGGVVYSFVRRSWGQARCLLAELSVVKGEGGSYGV